MAAAVAAVADILGLGGSGLPALLVDPGVRSVRGFSGWAVGDEKFCCRGA